MAQLTITATATATLDGQAYSAGGSGVVDVTNVVEQTRDVDDTYVTLTDKDFSFMAIVNKGTEDVLVRVRVGGGNYLFWGVPPDGHILLPGSGGDSASVIGAYDNPSVRSATSAGSRITVMIGINE